MVQLTNFETQTDVVQQQKSYAGENYNSFFEVFQMKLCSHVVDSFTLLVAKYVLILICMLLMLFFQV